VNGDQVIGDEFHPAAIAVGAEVGALPGEIGKQTGASGNGSAVATGVDHEIAIYGLGAGIWTRDISKAHRMAQQVKAGTVWINCYNVFDAAMPFGGYKQSGWGREMGHETLNLYTEVKSICLKI